MQSQNYKILIGVIGEDIHETGNKIIAQILEHDGFEVINFPFFFCRACKKR